MDFAAKENYRETASKLQERLRFGSYSELEQYPNWKDKINYIKEIKNSNRFCESLLRSHF